MSKSNEVMDQLGRTLVTEFASLFNDDGPGKNARMQDARDRIATEIRAAASVWAELEAECSAMTVRDDRRLKLRDDYKVTFPDDGMVHYGPNTSDKDTHLSHGIIEDRMSRVCTALHADGSETDHATRLEAHDALIASGSESPFVAVVGVVAKAKVEGGAS